MTNKRTSMTLAEIRLAADNSVGNHRCAGELLLARACLDLLDMIEKLRRVRRNLDLDSEWFELHGPWRE